MDYKTMAVTAEKLLVEIADGRASEDLVDELVSGVLDDGVVRLASDVDDLGRSETGRTRRAITLAEYIIYRSREADEDKQAPAFEHSNADHALEDEGDGE